MTFGIEYSEPAIRLINFPVATYKSYMNCSLSVNVSLRLIRVANACDAELVLGSLHVVVRATQHKRFYLCSCNLLVHELSSPHYRHCMNHTWYTEVGGCRHLTGHGPCEPFWTLAAASVVAGPVAVFNGQPDFDF